MSRTDEPFSKREMTRELKYVTIRYGAMGNNKMGISDNEGITWNYMFL